MDQKKRNIELHIDLLPPNITQDKGKYRLDLTKMIRLDFVPFAGLSLRLTGKFTDKMQHHWSPLRKACAGPKGDVGLGLNPDIWTVDKVFYELDQKQFILECYPQLETLEQFEALRDLLTGYYGFHIDRHWPK